MLPALLLSLSLLALRPMLLWLAPIVLQRTCCYLWHLALRLPACGFYC